MNTDTPRFVTVRDAYLDAFYAAYVDCAVWAGLDWTVQEGENPIPLDTHYGVEDISEEAAREMREDCEGFIAEAGGLLNDWPVGFAGHDFYLTRNGHGAGFWDRGLPAGDELTALCKPYGTAELYPGDDGKLYEGH